MWAGPNEKHISMTLRPERTAICFPNKLATFYPRHVRIRQTQVVNDTPMTVYFCYGGPGGFYDT